MINTTEFLRRHLEYIKLHLEGTEPDKIVKAGHHVKAIRTIRAELLDEVFVAFNLLKQQD